MLLNGIFKCTTEGFPTAGLGRLGYGNTAVSLFICKKFQRVKGKLIRFFETMGPALSPSAFLTIKFLKSASSNQKLFCEDYGNGSKVFLAIS